MVDYLNNNKSYNFLGTINKSGTLQLFGNIVEIKFKSESLVKR